MVKSKRRKRKLSKTTSTDDDDMAKIEKALKKTGKITNFQLEQIIKFAIWKTGNDTTPINPHLNEEW